MRFRGPARFLTRVARGASLCGRVLWSFVRQCLGASVSAAAAAAAAVASLSSSFPLFHPFLSLAPPFFSWFLSCRRPPLVTMQAEGVSEFYSLLLPSSDAACDALVCDDDESLSSLSPSCATGSPSSSSSAAAHHHLGFSSPNSLDSVESLESYFLGASSAAGLDRKSTRLNSSH